MPRDPGAATARVPAGPLPHRLPRRLVAGLLLTGVSWALYWTAVTAWTEVFFFGLWSGYVLIVDGLVHRRTGDSLLDRGRAGFVLVFVLSVPFWWAFEWCNWRLHNWSYVHPVAQDRLSHVLLFSLCFSTVLPALFETAELLGSTRLFRGSWRGPRLPHTTALSWAVTVLGLLALVLMLLFPRQLFPLVWVFPVLVLDPVNCRAGRPSLWGEVARGRWRLLFLLALTGLGCGLLWEFWNEWTAGVHWRYHLPAFLSHPHLFRMPLPGYLGYVPFAGSAYACYQSARHLLAPRAAGPVDLRTPAGPTR
ncbi:hypothetical protein AB0O91_07600 [Kitasatospora sp. NPDC089797]|uniref:hypothetical protein n=1 Tax=Kitasatospora sp. NPDC089797 TaxID=3155298 RepID=UPI00342D3D3C